MVRNITQSDFSFIYNLYMHPKVNPFLLYEMMDETSFRLVFDDLLKQNIIFIYSEGSENIGMFKLIPLQHRSSHVAYLGGLAIQPSYAGQGFGKKMMDEILQLGKAQNLKRIELSTATINTPAIKLYKKCGFEVEGVLRKYCYLQSENRYLDEQLMSYIYED